MMGRPTKQSAIVRKFAPRVKHVRKKNGGQVSAFKTGDTAAAAAAILRNAKLVREAAARTISRVGVAGRPHRLKCPASIWQIYSIINLLAYLISICLDTRRFP